MSAAKPPSYRKRDDRNQAIVTLTDRHTKVRRDYYLGPYESDESRELYHRLLAEWEAAGRRLPEHPGGATPDAQAGITISEIVQAYWQHCESYYQSQEKHCIKVVLRLLRQLFGQTPATDFGPRKLKLVREQMVKGDQRAKPPRQPWSRGYVNHQVKRLCRMLKWAAGEELLPVSIYQQTSTAEPLKLGRTKARETPPVKPVSMEMVDAVRPFVSRQVEALIDLQLLTGARGGELFKLRRVDLKTDEMQGVWVYAPIEHKTAYLEKERTIVFGPKAQEILKPFLMGKTPDAYLFSPAEAEAERRASLTASRKTALSCGNTVGSNRRPRPQKKPGSYYTRSSYLQSIYYACGRAFLPPEHLRPRKPAKGRAESRKKLMERLKEEEKTELKTWRKTHRWHPHQLRHVSATELRRKFGLEAAQLVLGHSSAQITDAIYAERDLGKVAAVMQQVG